MPQPELSRVADRPAGSIDIDLLASSPSCIGRVVLAVRDLDTVSRFYQQTVGLAVLGRDAHDLYLGAGGHALLTLRHEPAATISSRGDAGLYHTAFLLPGRSDLGSWLSHARANAVAIDGTADHFVSDAVYLSDPEGNGVEIYADRPSSTWHQPGCFPEMRIAPLDAAGLLRAAGGRPWSGMPDTARIGHVHLRVGDIAAADAFYAGLLGFDCNPFAPTAHFYSAGGYHHQVAANCWQSRGAPSRLKGTTGLVEMQIVYRRTDMFETSRAGILAVGSRVRRESRDLVVADPCGVAVRLTPPWPP